MTPLRAKKVDGGSGRVTADTVKLPYYDLRLVCTFKASAAGSKESTEPKQ